MKYLIIGGGIAGTTAAEEIRKRDAAGEITIIDAEPHRLYSRVLLPHYAEGRIPREKVFLKKSEWYQDHNIELMSHVEVTKIDLTNKFVETIEARELPFDKLLLTTGGNVKLLPDDRAGVVYLRNLDDTDQIVERINQIKALPASERAAVIYGGGFISLEFLNIFAKHQIKTTLVMRSGGFWSKILSKGSQQVIRAHIEKHGVRVVTDEPDIVLVGKSELEGVQLKDGEVVKAKMLGVGIGIEPDFALLKDAGIETGAGVMANEYLETAHENVYTAGDVAQFEDVIANRRVIQGNWMNAIMQGRVVGKTMSGERTRFELVSSYATDFLEKNVVFIGDVSREHTTQDQLVLDDENAIETFSRDGRLVGAVLIGDVTRRQELTNAIKNKQHA